LSEKSPSELGVLQFLEKYVQPPTFLLVAEEGAHADFLLEHLRRCGGDVLHIPDPMEAGMVVLMRPFNLVILDLAVNISAYRFIEVMKTHRHGYPLLVMIPPGEAVSSKLYELGAVTIIGKNLLTTPFCFCDLFAVFKLRCKSSSLSIGFQVTELDRKVCEVCSVPFSSKPPTL